MPSDVKAGLPLSADRQVPKCNEGGYGLVAEHVLAKDETGVRFSLPAQYETFSALARQFPFGFQKSCGF